MGDFYQNGVVTTLHNLSEHSIHSIKTARVLYDDIELRSAVRNVPGGIFISWNFRHGDCPATVRSVTRFGWEAKPRSSGAMEIPVRVFAHGVATLEIEEVFHMSRSIVRIKADFNIPELGGDDGLGIFLFKLQGGWCRHSFGTLAGGCEGHQASRAFQPSGSWK